ncbi:hypothetical protein F5882DRAFT_493778 [Hyaloscypha sp. PMI_1271]|nr:hypothetical protein F5882DRAFT_493778 [Hyaloscypha sp. PMI_1271]
MPLIAPWHLGRKPLENAQLEDPSGVKAWVDQKLEETSVGAIIAAVASAALSWATAPTWPWTVTSTVYSSLILSLISVYTGCQQHIAVLRYGKHNNGTERMRHFLRSHSLQGIVWSVPLMVLNISILLLIVSILIIVWIRAVEEPTFGREAKVRV